MLAPSANGVVGSGVPQLHADHLRPELDVGVQQPESQMNERSHWPISALLRKVV